MPCDLENSGNHNPILIEKEKQIVLNDTGSYIIFEYSSVEEKKKGSMTMSSKMYFTVLCIQ